MTTSPDLFPTAVAPAAVAPETWVAEFRHPYFGWLDYDREFPDRDGAKAFNDRQTHAGSPYPRRVRRVA